MLSHSSNRISKSSSSNSWLIVKHNNHPCFSNSSSYLEIKVYSKELSQIIQTTKISSRFRVKLAWLDPKAKWQLLARLRMVKVSYSSRPTNSNSLVKNKMNKQIYRDRWWPKMSARCNQFNQILIKWNSSRCLDNSPNKNQEMLIRSRWLVQACLVSQELKMLNNSNRCKILNLLLKFKVSKVSQNKRINWTIKIVNSNNSNLEALTILRHNNRMLREIKRGMQQVKPMLAAIHKLTPSKWTSNHKTWQLQEDPVVCKTRCNRITFNSNSHSSQMEREKMKMLNKQLINSKIKLLERFQPIYSTKSSRK